MTTEFVIILKIFYCLVNRLQPLNWSLMIQSQLKRSEETHSSKFRTGTYSAGCGPQCTSIYGNTDGCGRERWRNRSSMNTALEQLIEELKQPNVDIERFTKQMSTTPFSAKSNKYPSNFSQAEPVKLFFSKPQTEHKTISKKGLF